MTVQFKEETFGPEALSLTDLAEKLTSLDWFSQFGNKDAAVEEQVRQFIETLGVSQFEVKWVSKEEVPATIGKLTFENSDIWQKLKDIPDQFKARIDEKDRNALLESMVDSIPEAVFHPSYSGAFQQMEDEKAIGYLVGNAMYISIMACTAAIAEQTELLEPLLNIVESGHTVLGLAENTIYIV